MDPARRALGAQNDITGAKKVPLVGYKETGCFRRKDLWQMDDEPCVPACWATFTGSAAVDRSAANPCIKDGAVTTTKEPSTGEPSRYRATRAWTRWVLLFGSLVTSGCHYSRPVAEEYVPNRTIGRATIAVAPALNLSGSADFDPNRFADLMASELSYADGISVIPVSRVLGILAAGGYDRVESEAHAGDLVESLGADAILVFAVTEYDPYDPPSIGITAEIYGSRPWIGMRMAGSIDPAKLISDELGPRERPSVQIVAETQRVFDAAHDAVIAEIRAFALGRDADDSPYGWRRYVVSQQGFIQFCCHATISALLTGERGVAAVGRRVGR